MASIQALKNSVNTNLPDNAGVGGNQKISPAQHRATENAIIDELKTRGLIESAIENLANLAGIESDKVFVAGYGLFKFVAAGLTVDNITVFAAQATGFWQLQKSFVSKASSILAPGALLAVDLTQGDVFKLSIDQNCTIGAPTGFKWNGKKIRFQITQTGAGSFQPTFTVVAGGYAFSMQQPQPDYTGQAAGEVNWIEFEYSADLAKWVCIRQYAQIV